MKKTRSGTQPCLRSCPLPLTSCRAYIAASRRTDRSIEARVESANRASEVHKKRTGRRLRITEDAVAREEMYEEEDDDLPRHALRPFNTSDPAASFRAYRALQYQMVARAQLANIQNANSNHSPSLPHGYYPGSLMPNAFSQNSGSPNGFMPPTFTQSPTQSNYSQHGYAQNMTSPMQQNNAFSDGLGQNSFPQFATSQYGFAAQNLAQNAMYQSFSPTVSQPGPAQQSFTQSSSVQNSSTQIRSSQPVYSGNESHASPVYQEMALEQPRTHQTMAPPQPSVQSPHRNIQTHIGQLSHPRLFHGRPSSTATLQQSNSPPNGVAQDAQRRTSLPDHQLQNPMADNLVSPQPISPHPISPLQRLVISTPENSLGQSPLTNSPNVVSSTQDAGYAPLTSSLPPESLQMLYPFQRTGGSLNPKLLGKNDKIPQAYNDRTTSPSKILNMKIEDPDSHWTSILGAEYQMKTFAQGEHQIDAGVTTSGDSWIISGVSPYQETDSASCVTPTFNLFGSENDQANSTGQQFDHVNFFSFQEEDLNAFDDVNLNSFFDMTAFDSQRPT